MIDIKKYYEYCVGVGYLDKRKYYEDVSQEKAVNRVVRDNLEQAEAATIRSALARTKSTKNAESNLFPDPTPFQHVVLTLLKPVQVMVLYFRQFITNLQQPPTQHPGTPLKGAALERAISNIMIFFFGDKKDRTEEKEKRKFNDLNHPDVWSRRPVEGTSGSGDTSSQR